MTVLFTLTYLGWMALADAVRREVSLRMLAIGSVAALGFAGWNLRNGMISLESLALGMLPGVILLLIFGLTRGAGLGDAVILFQLDLLLVWDRVIMTFAFSLLIMGFFSAGILLLKKAGKNVRLPYVPFLWLGYVGMLCVCGW